MVTWTVHQGEVPGALDQLEPGSAHACVTDPPYELGFMGKGWDSSGVAFSPETWRAVYRVLKPGGHLLAFGGSRTYHRIACAIEDAGFELRDTLMWVYGSGFPKSLDVSKAIDKAAGVERRDTYADRPGVTDNLAFGNGLGVKLVQRNPVTKAARVWDGWGTALKPAFEPIILARKPLGSTVAACVLANGTGALNVDACRIPFTDEEDKAAAAAAAAAAAQRVSHVGHLGTKTFARVGDLSASINGYLSRIDGGRWPANVLHDGSDEVTALLGKAARFFYHGKASVADREFGCDELETRQVARVNGGGGLEDDPKWAPRQRRNTHVTVKPTAVMEWLVRLVTPPGGLVLDPFTGSGTTGVAALRQGFSFVGFEMAEEHVKIARARVGWAALHPLERAAKTAGQEQETLLGKPHEDSDEDDGKETPW